MKNHSKLLSTAVFVPFVALLIIGLVFFLDAPLTMRDGVVTGKTGRVHTVEEFHCFRLWERTLLGVGGVLAVLCIGSTIQHYRRTGSFRRDAHLMNPKHANDLTNR